MYSVHNNVYACFAALKSKACSKKTNWTAPPSHLWFSTGFWNLVTFAAFVGKHPAWLWFVSMMYYIGISSEWNIIVFGWRKKGSSQKVTKLSKPVLMVIHTVNSYAGHRRLSTGPRYLPVSHVQHPTEHSFRELFLWLKWAFQWCSSLWVTQASLATHLYQLLKASSDLGGILNLIYHLCPICGEWEFASFPQGKALQHVSWNPSLWC